MFALINSQTREVWAVQKTRPGVGSYTSPIVAVYVTAAEANTLAPHAYVLTPVSGSPGDYERTEVPGTVVTQVQLDSALTRQTYLRERLQAALDFAKSLTGTPFLSLTNDQLRQLLQLQFAVAGWIDVSGNLDLSDVTIDVLLSAETE